MSDSSNSILATTCETLFDADASLASGAQTEGPHAPGDVAPYLVYGKPELIRELARRIPEPIAQGCSWRSTLLGARPPHSGRVPEST